MTEFANQVYEIVWSPFLVYILLGTGLYFSLRSRFVQLRMVGEMLRLMFQRKNDNSGVSSFQALSRPPLPLRSVPVTSLVPPQPSFRAAPVPFSGCGWWRF